MYQHVKDVKDVKDVMMLIFFFFYSELDAVDHVTAAGTAVNMNCHLHRVDQMFAGMKWRQKPPGSEPGSCGGMFEPGCPSVLTVCQGCWFRKNFVISQRWQPFLKVKSLQFVLFLLLMLQEQRLKHPPSLTQEYFSTCWKIFGIWSQKMKIYLSLICAHPLITDYFDTLTAGWKTLHLHSYRNNPDIAFHERQSNLLEIRFITYNNQFPMMPCWGHEPL